MKNGTDSLIKLFKSEDDFIEHFIKSSFFFSKETVEKKAKELLDTVKNREKLPIRYTSKVKGNFKGQGIKMKSHDTKEKIKKLVLADNFYFIDKNDDIPVFVDSTGNQNLVKLIGEETGYLVSTSNSNIINYTISHIWEGTTYNPYFFTSLWNVAIIPTYLNYIMDKPSKQDVMNGKIQGIMTAICYKLYDPINLMEKRVEISEPSPEHLEWANKAINQKWINYLKKEGNMENIEQDLSEGLSQLTKKKNSDFIFELLGVLRDNDLLYKAIPILTDKDRCKDELGHYWPILMEKDGDIDKVKKSGKKGYYSKTFNFDDIEYYVTNDWYGENGDNQRENRSLILVWVENLLNQSIT